MKPEGTEFANESEEFKDCDYIEDCQKITVKNMADINGDILRTAKTRTKVHTGLVEHVHIKDYSQDGEKVVNPVSIYLSNTDAWDEANFRLSRRAPDLSTNTVSVYFTKRGNAIQARVKMTPSMTEFVLNDVKDWDYKKVEFEPGPKMTRT
ncbi:hypothetical protein THASP1DRAFT_30975 [Thamnocephalis sphaerospora]|uniref:Uncharacterized protein n=1 Tax=Thamnocephalis sphaerospora TaxID=78915 RepID=A0A4P9XPM1_9FUNG|nr:hypothetical protein THASP1DRAFT_30975 [Thamnocephalis sphaerospora]|eukprot:RKP07210.1 hypothetical protein THASP1DRAFT_30975 [Thamnocephalis sphaerospora]